MALRRASTPCSLASSSACILSALALFWASRVCAACCICENAASCGCDGTVTTSSRQELSVTGRLGWLLFPAGSYSQLCCSAVIVTCHQSYSNRDGISPSQLLLQLPPAQLHAAQATRISITKTNQQQKPSPQFSTTVPAYPRAHAILDCATPLSFPKKVAMSQPRTCATTLAGGA